MYALPQSYQMQSVFTKGHWKKVIMKNSTIFEYFCGYEHNRPTLYHGDDVVVLTVCFYSYLIYEKVRGECLCWSQPYWTRDVPCSLCIYIYQKGHVLLYDLYGSKTTLVLLEENDKIILLKRGLELHKVVFNQSERHFNTLIAWM